MNKLFAILLSSLFATASFAQATTGATKTLPEAETPGSAKAQAAAQAKADAKPKVGTKAAKEVEAEKPANEKAQSVAEAKKAKKSKPKKNRTDSQLDKDAKKLN